MRAPPSDLAEWCDADHGDCDSEHNICFFNRHLRLYVCGWMLSDGSKEGDARGLREARELYDGCGQNLLDRPGRLTTEAIVAEVLLMTDWRRASPAGG